MTEPAPARRKLSHFTVTVIAYDRLTQLLGDMPYKYAAGPLQILTEGSRAVWEEPAKDQGSIIDNPLPWNELDERMKKYIERDGGHEWSWDENVHRWRCNYCDGEDSDDITTEPSPGTCTQKAKDLELDNNQKESE